MNQNASNSVHNYGLVSGCLRELFDLAESKVVDGIGFGEETFDSHDGGVYLPGGKSDTD